LTGGPGIPTRRAVLAGAGALAAIRPAWSGESQDGERHGLSSFGELKYRPGFEHFDYVNPVAPKGGRFSSQLASTIGNQAHNTFNTLNIYVLRGDGAAGMNLTFDSLMVRALDEPDALYGLASRGVTVSQDGLTYTFSLRPQARFHDGSRLTARDAAFSLTLLRDKGHPEIAEVIRAMSEARAEGDERLVVTFAPGRARDLPLFVAQLPIFSAA
jgi:microcin C transport system substrate-binding protein